MAKYQFIDGSVKTEDDILLAAQEEGIEFHDYLELYGGSAIVEETETDENLDNTSTDFLSDPAEEDSYIQHSENKLKRYTKEELAEYKNIFDMAVAGGKNKFIVENKEAIDYYKETGKINVDLLPETITEYDLEFDPDNIKTWVNKSDEDLMKDLHDKYGGAITMHDPSGWTSRLTIGYGDNTENIDLQPWGLFAEAGRVKAVEQFKKIDDWYKLLKNGGIDKQMLSNIDNLDLTKPREFDTDKFNQQYDATGISVNQSGLSDNKLHSIYDVSKNGKIINSFELPIKNNTIDYTPLKEYIKSITTDKDVAVMKQNAMTAASEYNKQQEKEYQKLLKDGENEVTDSDVESSFFNNAYNDSGSSFSKRMLYNPAFDKMSDDDKKILKAWLKNKRKTSHEITGHGEFAEKRNFKGKELTNHFTDISDLKLSQEGMDMLNQEIISGDAKYKNVIEQAIKTGFASKIQETIDSRWQPIAERLYAAQENPEIIELGGLYANLESKRKEKQIRDYIPMINKKNQELADVTKYAGDNLVDIAKRDGISFSVDFVDNEVDGILDNVVIDVTSMPENYDPTEFKNAFSDLRNLVMGQQIDQAKQNADFETMVGEWEEFNNDYGKLQNVIFKEYDGGKILWNDWNSGWQQLVYSVPALFGEDWSIQKIENIEKRKQNFETMRTYGDAWSNDESLFFAARQVSTQGANLTVAIGTFGFGMAPATTNALNGLRTLNGVRTIGSLQKVAPGAYAMAKKASWLTAQKMATNRLAWTVAGTFGVTSGGQKNATLTNGQRDALQAKQYLKYLKKNKMFYTADEYLEAFQNTQSTIALKDITTAERALSVTGTALTETLFTRYIGTVPNALNATQAFRKGGRNVYMAAQNPAILTSQLANRGNWQAAAHAIGKTSLAIGGEVIEETGIEATVTTIDGLVLGAPYDYSHLDDVAVTAILVSGPANGPSVTYSTIMQQAATKPWRDETRKLTKEYNDLKKKLTSDMTQQELENHHLKLNDKYKEIIAMTEGLEADMIAVGGKGLKTLIKNNQTLKILYDAAGIKITDTEVQIQEKINLYKRKLKSQGKGDQAEQYQERINSLLESNISVMEDVNFDDMVSLRLGKVGKEIEDRFREEKNKEWMKAKGPKEKFQVVLKAFKKQLDENTIKEAKTSKFVTPENEEVSGQEMINQVIYGNIKGPGRGKKRFRKAENELLLQLGRSNKRTEGEIKADYESSLELAKSIFGEDVEFDKVNNVEDFQKKYDKRFPKSKSDARQSSGFYDPKRHVFVVNEMIMRNFGGDTYASSHELLHGVLSKVLYNDKGKVSEKGQKIIDDFKIKIGKKNLKIVEARLKARNYEVDENGRYIDQDEYVNQFYSAIKDGEITLEEDNLDKAASWFRGAVASIGMDVNIEDGVDLLNFIKDYKKGVEEGGVYRKRIITLGKKSADYKMTGKDGKMQGAPKEDNAKRKERLNELYEKNKGNWENNLNARNGELLNTILNAYTNNIEGVIYGSKMLQTPTFTNNDGSINEEAIQDAIFETRIELVNHIRNFNKKFREGDEDAVENNDFDGWVNSYIRAKFLEGVKKIKKEKFTSVNLDDALNMPTTTVEEWVADIVYQSITESGMFTDNFIKNILEDIAAILPTTKANINQKVSKNVTITPFVTEIKQVLSRLIDLKIRQTMGGKVGGKFKTWLLANKQTIIENMTTTYLMGKDNKAKGVVEGGIPQAIEKSVGGVWVKVENAEGKMEDVFQPNWVPFPQWVGKKPDREKSKKTDRTDGKQLVRRVPFEQVDDIAYLGQFLKGDIKIEIQEKESDVIGSQKESLAKRIAEELGFELFTGDLETDGPISQKWNMSEELKGRVVAENRISEFRRQVDRGNAKMSGYIAPGTNLDFLQQQLLGLVKNAVKYNSDSAMFAAIKASTNPQVVYIAEALDLFRFHGQAVTNYKTPLKTWEELPSVFTDHMTKFQDKTIQSEDAKKELAEASSKLMDALPNELVALLPMEFFGLQLRGLDPNSTLKEIQDLKTKYETIKAGNLEAAKKGKFKDVRIYNSKYGLMNRINTILYKEFKTAKAKREAVKKKFGNELENANKANYEALELVFQTIIEIVAANPEISVGVMRLFQDSAVKGMRGLTTLNLIQYSARSQAPWIRIDKKGNRKGFASRNLKDIRYTWEINKKHINYKDVIREFPEKNFKVSKKLKTYDEMVAFHLSQYGEHVKPAANEFLGYTQHILTTAGKIIKNTDEKKTILAQSSLEIKDLIAGFEQTLGAEVNSFIQDKKKYGGKTSKAGIYRGLVLNKKTLNSFYTIDGVQALGYIARTIPSYNQLKEKGFDIDFDLQVEQNVILKARDKSKMSKSIKGISVFDFDDTLATTKSEVLAKFPDGTLRRFTPTEFARKYDELVASKAIFDFSEFNKVVKGKKGPLADLALKRQGKFGSGDIYVLTARPQTSAKAIHTFLKGIGLNIPLKNITGLENGTPKAKADWILQKVSEGYNNFYFADDAVKNVKEVARVLDMLPDVKSEVEIAKFSKIDRSKTFNEILEQTKGVKAEARFSDVVARRKGNKSGIKLYLPPNAEDFMGLMYAFLGRGKMGEDQKQWLIENLIHPYARGINAINDTKQAIKNDYKHLLSKFPGLKNKLKKEIPSGYFTWDQAIRVYLWTKQGIGIPGISKRDVARILKDVSKDKDIQNFANTLVTIVNNNGVYPEPSQYWDSQSILSDISSMTFKVGRKKFLKEFINNKNEIFNKENLNKIEAIYGTNFREALEDILWRMENGTNRKMGQNKATRIFSTWVNNSVGAVMFFNTRSAVLQTLSMVNFLNWTDNNPLKAGLALANIPQFASDFVFIFNSNKLKQRRAGLQTDINESEIANAVKNSTNRPQAILAYLLKKGFLPTQIADSFAIAAGGAPMYRNRINTYLKQGMSKADAEAQAWEDFALIADETQQSADPMLISQIQASPLGRFIFAWQNTPFQYNRLMKKAALDLINNRGDHKTNISKIIYYGAVQNFIFSALQSALFAMLPGFNGDEDEDEEIQSQKDLAKQIRVANNMIDTLLRGSGLPGAIVSTVKNIIMEYNEQEKKGFLADHTYTLIEAFNISPPIGTKARKFYGGIQTRRFEKDVINEKGWAYDSPRWEVVGGITAAATNIPLDRLVIKLQNIIAALDDRNEAWQRIATMSGWPTWTVGVETFPEHEQIKINAKLIRKEEGKIKAKKTRELNKKLKEEVETIIFSKSSSIQWFYKLTKEEQKEYLKNEVEKLKKKRNL